MRNLRAYYSSEIEEFLNKTDDEILGIIHKNDASTETTYNEPRKQDRQNS